jgi:hypothetical protein
MAVAQLLASSCRTATCGYDATTIGGGTRGTTATSSSAAAVPPTGSLVQVLARHSEKRHHSDGFLRGHMHAADESRWLPHAAGVGRRSVGRRQQATAPHAPGHVTAVSQSTHAAACKERTCRAQALGAGGQLLQAHHSPGSGAALASSFQRSVVSTGSAMAAHVPSGTALEAGPFAQG